MSASAPGDGDRADEGADAAVVAAQVEDLLDDGAILALELAGEAGGRRLVGALVHLDAEVAVGVGRCRARDAAMEGGQRDGRALAREPHAA